MSTFEIILALATVLVGGLGLTLFAFVERLRRDDLPLVLAIGIGIWALCRGVGMLAWGGRCPQVGAVAEVAVVLLGCTSVGRHACKAIKGDAGTLEKTGLLTLVFLAMLFAWAGAFVIESRWHPDGDWDAWAMWNLRARFLYRAPHDLATVFASILPHTDYPPLLPIVICSVWRMMGRESNVVPPAVAGLLACLVVGVLVGAVTRLRGRRVGLLAGVVLLGTPVFLNQSEKQMADVPLSLFLLSGSVFLAMGVHSPMRAGRMFLLSGLAVSLGACTKNEGNLHLIALGLAIWVCTPSRAPENRRSDAVAARLRSIACFALGALPAMLLLGCFKHFLAPANDLVAGTSGPSELHRLVTWSRYAKIASAIASTAIHVDHWNVFLVAIAGVWLAALWHRRVPAEARAVGLASALILIGYVGVYLLEPHDLSWILKTSLDRLILQVWPSLILATALLLSRPHADPRPEKGDSTCSGA